MEREFHLTSKVHLVALNAIEKPSSIGSCSLLGFNVHGSVHRKNILIYIQKDATLHSLFYLETALHISGGGTTRNMHSSFRIK